MTQTTGLADQVRQWLGRPGNYQAGVQLLTQTGAVGSLTIKVLARGENSYNRGRLVAELTTWVAGMSEPAPPSEGDPEPKPTKTGQINLGSVAPKPTAVLTLEGQTHALMNERGELKAKLRERMTDTGTAASEQRRVWALRIVGIGRELDRLFTDLNHYDEHGYLPMTTAGVDSDNEADTVLTLMNVRTYISRYRRKLKATNLTETQRGEFARLLAHYEAERDRLSSLIKP